MIRTVIHRPFTDGFRLPTGRSSEQSIELLASYDVALGWLGANSPNGGNVTFPAVVVRASTALESSVEIARALARRGVFLLESYDTGGDALSEIAPRCDTRLQVERRYRVVVEAANRRAQRLPSS